MLEPTIETFIVQKSKQTPTGEHKLDPVLRTLEIKQQQDTNPSSLQTSAINSPTRLLSTAGQSKVTPGRMFN